MKNSHTPAARQYTEELHARIMAGVEECFGNGTPAQAAPSCHDPAPRNGTTAPPEVRRPFHRTVELVP